MIARSFVENTIVTAENVDGVLAAVVVVVVVVNL